MTDSGAANSNGEESDRQKGQLEAALADQRMHWRSGSGELVEAILARLPQLRDDENAILDLLYNETLLRRERGERPTPEEYRTRFPGLADSLRILFDVDAQVESGGELLSVDSDRDAPVVAPTMRLPPRASPKTPAERIGSTEAGTIQPQRMGSDSRGTLEMHALLQRRLRFVAFMVTLMYAQSAWQLRSVWHIDHWPTYQFQMAIIWAVFIIAGGFAAFFVLRKELLSMTWLRGIEAILFAAPIFQLSSVLVDLTWLQGDLPRMLVTPEHDSGYVFNSMALFYFPSITCYGILIPNTARRCLIVTALAGITPLVILIAGLPSHPGVWSDHRLAFIEGFCWVTMWMSVGVLCATYGCYRITTLQREAFVARRLGQYRLRERLGSGGMGEVYLAEHVMLKQPCAVKIIRPERAGDPSALRRFEREVQATARLKHFNTVTIFDYGIAADGTFYYAMEYLPGLSLEEMVRQYGPLPPARVCHFLRQACAALREAHDIGLIHRDIKPANLIICERGGVHDVLKVLDFGLVREINTADRGGSLTAEGQLAGTPAYMSPEQASGSSELDARSDVYSLGAVAYFLLTGRPPFANRRPVEVLAAHLYETPQSIRALNPKVSSAFAEIVLRCLAKKPNDRYDSAPTLDSTLTELEFAGKWTEADASGWWTQHAARAAT